MVKKRVLSILLVMVMAMTLLPMTVSAANETVTVNNGMWITPATTNEEIAAAFGEGVATIHESNGVYTITLLKNITMTGAALPLSIGVQFGGSEQPLMVLDLNGCVVTSNTTVIANYGNLTIKDSAGGGKVVYNGGNYLSAVNNVGSTLTIDGGYFECQGAGSVTYNAAISSTPNTKTVINNGTFEGNGAGALITYGDVDINGGTFEGKYGVVSKQGPEGEGSITFTENSTAVVNADSMAFVVQGDGNKDGKITALGGSFNAPAIAGRLGQAVTKNDIEIAGGSFTVSPADYVSEGAPLASFTTSGTTDPSAYAVGAKSIAAKATSAAGGDTVDILSGDVKLELHTDGIHVSNSGGGKVTVNQIPVPEDAPITVCVHTWGEPVWTWAKDNRTATATFTCSKDASHTETVTAVVSSAVKTEATSTTKGVTAYTAKVTFDHVEYTDIKEVADIDILSASVPETGDNNSIVVWIALLLVSTTGVFGTTLLNRKSRVK